MVIELTSRVGFAEFDFSTDDEPYKAEWCGGRPVSTGQTEPFTIPGALARPGIADKRGIKFNDLLLGVLRTVNAHRSALFCGFGARAHA